MEKIKEGYIMYYGLFILSFIIVFGAQMLVKGAYGKYKMVETKKGLTGLEVARKILDLNGLNELYVVETKGVMSDHYDSRNKVVRLSPDVYHKKSIASVAIAAHECGHAVQHKEKYWFLTIRNLIIPIVNLSSKIGYIILIIGFITSALDMAMVGLILLGLTLLFQLITLPVEFDASKRAKKILIEENLIYKDEKVKIGNMLNAAAMTYVAALISNFLELFRLFLMISKRD